MRLYSSLLLATVSLPSGIALAFFPSGTLLGSSAIVSSSDRCMCTVLSSSNSDTNSITSNNPSSSDPSTGAIPPLGLWDPLDWVDPSKDPSSSFASFHERFERSRAVERKHGRIAMVAAVGMLFHYSNIEFPGYLSTSADIRFSDIPNGMTGFFSIPFAGLLQILLAVGVVELAIWPASNYSGNYGTGYGRPFVPNFLEGEELNYKLSLETNQGRLAMMGFLGAMVAEAIIGNNIVKQIIDSSVN